MALVEFLDVHPDCAEAQHCLTRYFAEIAGRFEDGFDPRQSSAPTLDDFTPPAGTFLLVRLDGALVGCGGFKREASGAAYIKRMWVAPEARGHGVRLETEKTLAEAQQLYRSSGYAEVPRFNDELYAHHWFEKTLR